MIMVLRGIRSLAGLGAVWLAVAGPALAAPSCHVDGVALVIGNAAYPDNDAPLQEPHANARAVAAALKALGYATTEAEDLTGDGLQSALADLTEKVTRATRVFVFFSGFGIQSGGHTYLIPVDAKIWSEQDVKTVGIGLDKLLADLAGRGAPVRVAVVDAARRNPFERRFRASGSAGLAPVVGATGLLAFYSTAPGAVFDEAGSGLSPFADDLVKRIAEPNARAESSFRRVLRDVSHLSRTGQTPWVSSFLDSDISLDGSDCQADGAAVASAPSTPEVRTAPAGPPPASLAVTPAQPAAPVAVVPRSEATAVRPVQQVANAPFPADDVKASDAAVTALAVTSCDRLAASPFDSRRSADIAGVEFDKIDALQAVPACRKAHEADTRNDRILFELGRSLQKAGDPEAADIYRRAADTGDGLAMNNLGNVYEHGVGIGQDLEEAVRWYRKSTEVGNALGMYSLGHMYEIGAGLPLDFHEAVYWYSKASNAGNTLGMTNLGRMYEYGRGTSINLAEAVRLHRKAADAGNAFGMNNLGHMYAVGLGIAKDPEHAVYLYHQAADAGNASGMNNLGYMYEIGAGVPKDIAEAVRWYRKAADAGEAFGINNLGHMYEAGAGVPQNLAEAMRLYSKAADAGNTLGMTNLGRMYEHGRGTAIDLAGAARWYRKAADAGNGRGMTSLGFLYASGNGVPKDPEEAVRWYRKAAEAGDASGMNNLGFMSASGSGMPKDMEEAIRWYRKAAEAGNTLGMTNLGVVYETGSGIAKNPEEAFRWYRKAADAGDGHGMNNLGAMYERGIGVPADHNMAVAWYRKAVDAGYDQARPALERVSKATVR